MRASTAKRIIPTTRPAPRAPRHPTREPRSGNDARARRDRALGPAQRCSPEFARLAAAALHARSSRSERGAYATPIRAPSSVSSAARPCASGTCVRACAPAQGEIVSCCAQRVATTASAPRPSTRAPRCRRCAPTRAALARADGDTDARAVDRGHTCLKLTPGKSPFPRSRLRAPV